MELCKNDGKKGAENDRQERSVRLSSETRDMLIACSCLVVRLYSDSTEKLSTLLQQEGGQRTHGLKQSKTPSRCCNKKLNLMHALALLCLHLHTVQRDGRMVIVVSANNVVGDLLWFLGSVHGWYDNMIGSTII